jgi:hypothetical protein
MDLVKGTEDVLDKGSVVRLVIGPQSPGGLLVRLAQRSSQRG